MAPSHTTTPSPSFSRKGFTPAADEELRMKSQSNAGRRWGASV